MPISVIYVIDSFKNPQAGTEGQLYQLIKGLDRSRYTPKLLVFKDSEYLKSKEFPCEYKVLGCNGLSSLKAWSILWKEAKLFKKSGGGVVHAFFIDPSIMCPIVFELNGIRTVISRRDMGYWYTESYLFFLRISGKFVSSVISNSNAVQNIVKENEWISNEKLSVVYNGYDTDFKVESVPSDISRFKNEFPDSVLVVLVANVRPIKRIQDAIQAVSIAVGQGVDLHLMVIGDGDTGELKEYANTKLVADRTHFLGPRIDVKACLGGFDIGILCSESEGFSNSIIEYMQAGLPVICSSVGGNPEAIEHGVSGFLYPVGDVVSLAHYMSDLAADKFLRELLGQAGRSAAKIRFGMSKMIESHQNLYYELTL